MTDRVSKIILRGDISDLQAKMVAAGRSLRSVVEQSTNATKESRKFRQGLESAADAAGKMALVTGAAFVGIQASAANFEQAMSNVRAATHETAQGMATLRDAALEAGAKTVFSATEAAGAVENLAKAGVSTQDILAGGLDGALSLAAAGSLEVADAAEVAATAMTQFKLAGTDVEHIADLLAAGAGKAQGEVSDLAFALKQSGLVANNLGLSIEETTGALAAFASAGLLGSDAGTSFKTMLGALTPNSAKAAKEMKRLGIDAFDAQGNFVGLTEFAGNLRNSLAGLSDEQRAASLEIVFGSDAVRAATELYNQGADGIANWIAQVDDTGFAAETAAIKLDNLKGDLEALTGSLETLFITSGEGSQGFLRSATQGATDFVNALNSLPAEAKNTATALLGITAITGGALWFGSRVVRGIADTREALDNLGASGRRASRALQLVGRVGVSIAAIQALDSVIDQLEQSMSDALPATNALAGSLLDLRDGRIKDIGKEFGDLGESLEAIKNQGPSLFSDIIPNVTGLLPGENSIERLHRARREVASLDDALASLVASGSAGTAKDAFDALAESEGLSGKQRRELLRQLPNYSEALSGAANDARLAATGETALAGSAQSVTTAIEDQTKAIEENLDKMREKRQAALDAQNAEIGYQRALDEARKSIKENGRTLDLTTEKGRQNKEALLDVAASWNELSDAAKNKKGARDQAIQEFVALAEQMGLGEKAARKLARRLLEMPPKVVTKATVDTQEAEEALNRFVKLANGKRIVIKADGSFTTSGGNTGFAIGGYTGDGGKYQPAGIVHAGEFVFDAESTRGNVAMLYGLQRQLRGYANGGHVQRGEAHMARSYTTTNNYYTAPAAPSAPLISVGTVRHNDMRETVRWARQTASLRGTGGEDF